jgi:hypothetical protein
MNRENPIVPRNRFKNGVLAALEICAETRAQESGFEPSPDSHGKRYNVDRAAAIIEAAAQKIGADDFSALEGLCAGHVLALDMIFGQFARDAAQRKTLSEREIAFALRAQSQCRATIKVLAGLAAKKKSPNFAEQTIGMTNLVR